MPLCIGANVAICHLFRIVELGGRTMHCLWAKMSWLAMATSNQGNFLVPAYTHPNGHTVYNIPAHAGIISSVEPTNTIYSQHDSSRYRHRMLDASTCISTPIHCPYPPGSAPLILGMDHDIFHFNNTCDDRPFVRVLFDGNGNTDHCLLDICMVCVPSNVYCYPTTDCSRTT